jgi:hypothetical protein
MAFSDEKSPGDLISSTEFNNFVDSFLNHSSRHSTSGSDTIDVTNLDGSSGSKDQFLTTDGSSLGFERGIREQTVELLGINTANLQTEILDQQPVILCSTATDPELTVTLSSVDAVDGAIVRVVDRDGNAANNPITIETESDETINGEPNAVITNNFEALTFISDGVDWVIVSRMSGGSVQ